MGMTCVCLTISYFGGGVEWESVQSNHNGQDGACPILSVVVALEYVAKEISLHRGLVGVLLSVIAYYRELEVFTLEGVNDQYEPADEPHDLQQNEEDSKKGSDH